MGEEENTPLQAKMGKRVEKSLVSGHLSEGLFKLLSENFHEKKVGYPRMAFDSLVSGHLCEGLFELLSDSLVLLLLVLISLALENLLGSLRVISSSGGLVKLGHSGNHLLLGLLQVLLEAGHPPVQGVHLELAGRQLPLLLLELEGGNAQLLGGHVQLGLKLPSLGHQLVHLILSLGGSHLGSLALLLTNVHSVASVVLLHLHSLHLLLDALHGDDPVAGCQSGKGAAGSPH